MTITPDEARLVLLLLEERFPFIGGDDPDSAANCLQLIVDWHEELSILGRGGEVGRVIVTSQMPEDLPRGTWPDELPDEAYDPRDFEEMGRFGDPR